MKIIQFRKWLVSFVLAVVIVMVISNNVYADDTAGIQNDEDMIESNGTYVARSQDILALGGGSSYTERKTDSFHKGLGQKSMYVRVTVGEPCIFYMRIEKSDGKTFMPTHSLNVTSAGGYTFNLNQKIGYRDYKVKTFFDKPGITCSWQLYCE